MPTSRQLADVLSVGGHEVLDILGMVGDALLAQEAATVGCD